MKIQFTTKLHTQFRRNFEHETETLIINIFEYYTKEMQEELISKMQQECIY